MVTGGSDPPPPPIPPDADLRSMPWMPLHGERLMASDTWAIADGDEIRAAISLWWAAWHQLPPASLPADDRVLCNLAGCGRDMAMWARVRDVALRHWRQHADGRLYHPFLTELAIDAWKRVEAGRKGARARWGSPKARTPKAMPSHMPSHSGGLSDGYSRDNDNDNEGEKDSTRFDNAKGGEAPGPDSLSSPPGIPNPDPDRARRWPSGLWRRAWEAFVINDALRGATWNSSQVEAIGRLCDRAVLHPEPFKWLDRWLRTAKRLRSEGRGRWRDAPWMPSYMAGERNIVHVIEAMGGDPVVRHKTAPPREAPDPGAAEAATEMAERVRNLRKRQPD